MECTAYWQWLFLISLPSIILDFFSRATLTQCATHFHTYKKLGVNLINKIVKSLLTLAA